jgi:hypothetical protein
MRTPLIEAVIAGQAAAVDWLLAHGVDANATDGAMGWTALGWAAADDAAGLVQRLLAAGADVEGHADEYRRTPLMAAAQAGAEKAVDLLLAAGARPAAQDGQGCTAADLARRNGFEALAARLDALLPPALRADAPAPPVSTRPWPEEPLALLTWPDDFPPLPAPVDWQAVANGEDLRGFDRGFHAALAGRLAPAFASPTAALRSWAQSMHHWELAAHRAISGLEGAVALGRLDAMWHWLAGAMALRQAFATPRVRKHPKGSIGGQPALPLHMDWLDIEMPTAGKCVITTQHRMALADEDDVRQGAGTRGDALLDEWPAMEYRFTLMRQAGQWRVDSWQERHKGGSAWRSQIV